MAVAVRFDASEVDAEKRYGKSGSSAGAAVLVWLYSQSLPRTKVVTAFVPVPPPPEPELVVKKPESSNEFASVSSPLKLQTIKALLPKAGEGVQVSTVLPALQTETTGAGVAPPE